MQLAITAVICVTVAFVALMIAAVIHGRRRPE